MGRHSSDDSECSKSRRKKRRSRSGSYNRSKSRERSGRKKSKRKHRSPSAGRRRRSRSSSYELSRERSRSSSRKRSRRSHSRSTEKSHSSRGRNTDTKSKHKSSRRSRSRSKSFSRLSYTSSIKSSKSRKKSRSRSRGHSRSSDSTDSTSRSSRKTATLQKSQQSIASLDYLSAAEKVEAKLQMALKAAAAADETLKSQGLLAANASRRFNSMEDQQKRANAIEDIDGEGFTQAAFRSTRTEIPLPKGSVADASHAGAMFGTSASSAILDSKKPTGTTLRASVAVDTNSILHPNLFRTTEEKMGRWIQKLTEMRKKKLLETGGVIPR